MRAEQNTHLQHLLSLVFATAHPAVDTFRLGEGLSITTMQGHTTSPNSDKHTSELRKRGKIKGSTRKQSNQWFTSVSKESTRTQSI